jgi:hypothetical protein
MRLGAALALLLVAAAVGSAPAAEEEEIDAATLAEVIAVASMKQPDPPSAEVRNVHRSLATGGHGYCGEISAGSGDGTFTVFHALLRSALGPAVLLMSEYPETDGSPNAVAVRTMMHNFGCVE